MMFSLSLETQIPLESMTFPGWEIYGDINNPFSYLWRVFHPWACLPLASKLQALVQTAADAVTHIKKIIGRCSATSYSD
jgi:hypothetical protein